MNNVMKVVESGRCTGCGACAGCEHIAFVKNKNGFPAPVVDGSCADCGRCLGSCIYREDEEE